MARIDFNLYDIEFVRNLGYGFKTYTWYVIRANYRKGVHTSDTVWVYTTDSDSVYDYFRDINVSVEEFISFIKNHPKTKMYNEPLTH